MFSFEFYILLTSGFYVQKVMLMLFDSVLGLCRKYCILVADSMNKLLEFGRKAIFYVRVLSGYEERRIRSYRLQLQRRIEQVGCCYISFVRCVLCCVWNFVLGLLFIGWKEALKLLIHAGLLMECWCWSCHWKKKIAKTWENMENNEIYELRCLNMLIERFIQKLRSKYWKAKK